MTASIYPVTSEQTLDSLRHQLKGSKLVVPAISIGNVPQLSVDLLIHNLQLKLVARLDTLFLYPFAAPVDSAGDDKKVVKDGSASTALELYYNEELKLSVIQQRSPIIPDYSQNFLDYLVTVIKELGFGKVLILDSNDYGLKGDVDFEKPLELFSNELEERFKSLKVSNTNDLDKVKESFTTFTNALVTEINKIKEVTLQALLMYVYEGDNFFDAQVVTKEVFDLLKIAQPKHLIKPKSWEGAYGDRPIPTNFEEGLFG